VPHFHQTGRQPILPVSRPVIVHRAAHTLPLPWGIPAVRTKPKNRKPGTMDILLIVGVIMMVLSLLGMSGLVAALRSVAWVLLVLSLVVVTLSFIF
jgi:hypothetical protein